MRSKRIAQGLITLFLLGLILVSQFVLRLNAVRQATNLPLTLRPPAQPRAIDLNGEYSGQITLTSVFSGVYSDTNPVTITLNMGQIDLTLNLSQTGETVIGYVVLNNTLLFPQQHVIQVTPVTSPAAGTVPPGPVELAVGPLVQGTFDGTMLHLESEPFSVSQTEDQLLADGRKLTARQVTRQFYLHSSDLQTGDVITGRYRETLWGFATQPATVEGTVILARPVFTTTEELVPSPAAAP